ncbi:hypothetical protein DV452_002235 [Geotrichum candidum]|nr:hypothetical protein DV452_002235 [Geotrichum candidum]
MHFSDDCTSARTTPFFGPEDSKFEWSLNDIRVDVEPVANELLKKFTYLQFRGPGASQYLSFMRPQKIQNFRLPHPLAERWQLFRIEKEGIIEIDETSIVDQFPVYDDLDGGPLSQSNPSDGFEFPMRPSQEESPFMEFEKSPISSNNKVYAEIVTAALEKLISDNSLLKVAGSTNSLFDSNSSGGYNAEFFSNPFDSLSNPKGNDPFSNHNSFSSSPTSSSTSSPGYLLSILSDAGRRSIALSNYLEGNEYFSAVQALQKLFPSPSSATYIPVANEVNSYLMRCIKRDKENKLKSVARNLKRCEQISQPYQHYLKLSTNSCEMNIQHLHSLRVKVWYITEVRSSQVWTRARDVTISLNHGTDSVSFEGSESTSRSHTLKRNKSSASLSSASAFSFKRFTSGSKRDYQNKRHSMSHVPMGSADSMFAPVEYAGNNKLSDKEAEATKNWLDGQKIQIFCASEERIHRFSCEVDDLVKRVIGDASNTRRNRSQSLLTASPLFKSDLCKLIDEIDSMDRSSVVSANFMSKSQLYNLGNNDSATFDNENDLSNRRKSIDNISIDASNSSRSKQNSQDLGRSYSGRGHRSRKSSPNLIDMFSSLDMAGKRMSSTDLNIDLERSATSEFQGHRRNKSLNESSLGNISFTGSEENSAGPVYMDETDRQRHDEKREELDKFILELQMAVVSLIYTDLGLEGWSEVGAGANRVSVGPNTDAIAEELQRIFKTTEMESNTLFRDLQFIAAFVPSKVLDLTDMGKSFWDVSLAALSLKEENLLVITQTASELFKRHTGMISVDLSDDFLKKFSLKECAWLWSIASKEGDIEGQRELAMIHFSHPQIAPICVAPFSKLADVFSNTMLDDFRILEDPDKLDPIRMSIIKHWMSIAASRGDSIAKEYLSQQDFI